MDDLEVANGWIWRGRTANDRKAVEAFVKTWNSSKDQDDYSCVTQPQKEVPNNE